MAFVVKQSLASWRREHGFGVLRAVDQDGEQFSVFPAGNDVPAHLRVGPWSGRSEQALRDHLRRAGRQDAEIEQAIQIARDWTTTRQPCR